jgi:hypothetical protein
MGAMLATVVLIDVLHGCTWLMWFMDVFDWCASWILMTCLIPASWICLIDVLHECALIDVLDWCAWLMCLIDVFDWCGSWMCLIHVLWCALMWLMYVDDVFDWPPSRICLIDVLDWCAWLMCLIDALDWGFWLMCNLICESFTVTPPCAHRVQKAREVSKRKNLFRTFTRRFPNVAVLFPWSPCVTTYIFFFYQVQRAVMRVILGNLHRKRDQSYARNVWRVFFRALLVRVRVMTVCREHLVQVLVERWVVRIVQSVSFIHITICHLWFADSGKNLCLNWSVPVSSTCLVYFASFIIASFVFVFREIFFGISRYSMWRLWKRNFCGCCWSSVVYGLQSWKFSGWNVCGLEDEKIKIVHFDEL